LEIEIGQTGFRDDERMKAKTARTGESKIPGMQAKPVSEAQERDPKVGMRIASSIVLLD
jgi:hypothetical protein